MRGIPPAGMEKEKMRVLDEAINNLKQDIKKIFVEIEIIHTEINSIKNEVPEPIPGTDLKDIVGSEPGNEKEQEAPGQGPVNEKEADEKPEVVGIIDDKVETDETDENQPDGSGPEPGNELVQKTESDENKGPDETGSEQETDPFEE
jgi:hypothetical protein